MAGFRMKAELRGAETALAKLAGLKRGIANKILRPAVNAAARPVLATARSKVPVGATRMLYKSLAVKVRTYNRGPVVAIVGPRTGMTGTKNTGRKMTAFGKKLKAMKVNPSKYAHLAERGHRMVGHRPARKDTGKFVRGKPFIQPSLETAKTQSVAILAKRIAEGLAKVH